MFEKVKREIDAARMRDPAAGSRFEVILCYSGFQAIFLHRIAHRLWQRKWRVSARFIAHISRMITGIEIHPGAKIGTGFFIDHGMGVVIGETSVIGDNVTLYHGVTLGGVYPAVNSDAQRGVKRHPSLGNSVIVGSGAQILGPITVGCGARIGANAVVTQDVEECTTVVGIPARKIGRKNRNAPAQQPFAAYGIPQGEEIPDPVLRALEGLMGELQGLRTRIQELESEGDKMQQQDILTKSPASTKSE